MIRNFKHKLILGVLSLLGISGYSQTTFDFTGSIQTYTVPAGVTNIQIEAYGAQGGSTSTLDGGLGASMQGNFIVTPGQVLNILVGEWPGTTNNGGGGGTFVVEDGTDIPLIIAGGGGGASGDCCSVPAAGLPGVDTEDGTAGLDAGCAVGVGGTAGNGGTGGDPTNLGSGGGGGFYTNGGDGENAGSGGQSYLNGGAGGVCYDGSLAGYGGGGGFNDNGLWVLGSGGGGGGYSGGAGNCGVDDWGNGGGGGSYNVGTDQVNATGTHTGHGQVVITILCNPLTTTVSEDSLCDGEMVTLTASSISGGTISWDGGVVDGEAFTPPAGTTTYTATSDDVDDCGFSVDIVVFELPTVDAGEDVSVCEGEEATLSASGTATDWSWDGGVEDGVAFVPTADGTYTLTGTIDSTGCMATDEVEVTVVIVDVSMTVGAGNLTANQAGATYQWLECPDYTPISGEMDQTFSPAADADYAVEVTYEGCVDTSACQVVHVGFGENELPFAKIYPNPTNGLFQVELEGQFNYNLTNVLGEAVMGGQAVNKETFDLSGFAEGTYFLKVISEGKEQTFRVVKK